MPWKTNLTDLGKTIVGQSAQLLESSKFVPLTYYVTQFLCSEQFLVSVEK
jgi:hypothetical protein